MLTGNSAYDRKTLKSKADTNGRWFRGIGIQEKVKNDNDINGHRKQKSKNQHTVI
jgi:hypothetical protein